MKTSSEVTIPRSPWLASAGWTKKAGVPVLASVAAILRAICPDLPIPDTTTRPRQPSSSATAWTKPPSSWSRSAHGVRLDVEHVAGERERPVIIDFRYHARSIKGVCSPRRASDSSEVA